VIHVASRVKRVGRVLQEIGVGVYVTRRIVISAVHGNSKIEEGANAVVKNGIVAHCVRKTIMGIERISGKRLRPKAEEPQVVLRPYRTVVVVNARVFFG